MIAYTTLTIEDVRRAKRWLEANDLREPNPWALMPYEIKLLWPSVDDALLKPGATLELGGQKVRVIDDRERM